MSNNIQLNAVASEIGQSIVAEIFELAVSLPRDVAPPLCHSAVYEFLRDLGDCIRASVTARRERLAAFKVGGGAAESLKGSPETSAAKAVGRE